MCIRTRSLQGGCGEYEQDVLSTSRLNPLATEMLCAAMALCMMRISPILYGQW